MIRAEPILAPKVLAAIRAPLIEQDAITIDPPVVQPLALFLDLAGEAMRERLFIVQADGREEACLRPDLTVPAALAHIESGARTGRYVYKGKAFRASPAGLSRPEEFVQLGLEVYGAADPAEAEADVAAIAWRSAAAGGRKDLGVKVGDASLFAAFVAAIGAAPPIAERLVRAFGRPAALAGEIERAQAPAASRGGGLSGLLRGLPEDAAADALAELWSLAGIQPVGGRPAAEIVHRLIGRASEAATPLTAAQANLIGRYLAAAGTPETTLVTISALAPVGAAVEVTRGRILAMKAHGVPAERMTFVAGFGRAFSYYDGLLFDIVSAELGEDQPVAGGGRYDTLLTRLGASGGQSAVGCMVRPGRAVAGGAS